MGLKSAARDAARLARNLGKSAKAMEELGTSADKAMQHVQTAVNPGVIDASRPTENFGQFDFNRAGEDPFGRARRDFRAGGSRGGRKGILAPGERQSGGALSSGGEGGEGGSITGAASRGRGIPVSSEHAGIQFRSDSGAGAPFGSDLGGGQPPSGDKVSRGDEMQIRLLGQIVDALVTLASESHINRRSDTHRRMQR